MKLHLGNNVQTQNLLPPTVAQEEQCTASFICPHAKYEMNWLILESKGKPMRRTEKCKHPKQLFYP